MLRFLLDRAIRRGMVGTGVLAMCLPIVALALHAESLLCDRHLCGGRYTAGTNGDWVSSQLYFAIDLPDNLQSAYVEAEMWGDAQIDVLNRTLETRMPLFRPVGALKATACTRQSYSLHNVLAVEWESRTPDLALTHRNCENRLA